MGITIKDIIYEYLGYTALRVTLILTRTYVVFTLSQATKALRESRGIALLYF